MMRMNQEIVTTDADGHNRRERRAQVVDESKTPPPAVSRWDSRHSHFQSTCQFIYSSHDCILFTAHNDMARIYPSLSLLCILVLALLQTFVSAHMIEVVAGKKECFFEDLHVNDKVCIMLLITWYCSHLCTDDGYISSGRRRPSWHWFLGKHKSQPDNNEWINSPTARRPG